MVSYVKATDFLAKDSLPLNNAGKYVKGSEIDAEFDNIALADADNVKTSALGTGVAAFLATPSSANLATAVTGETGSGALVFATSPTLVTPALGTPASGTLTNCTGLPQAGVTGLTTADSPQFAAVNIGHASDTTVTRSAAGVIAVEGNNVVTADKCSIASGKTLTVSNSVTLTGTDSSSYNLDQLTSTPQNSQNAGYTLVLGDAGKHIYMATAGVFTIPANASVAFPTGTVINFYNPSTSSTLAITSDTLVLAGTGATGTRTLAQYAIVSIMKVASTTWVISGTGVS